MSNTHPDHPLTSWLLLLHAPGLGARGTSELLTRHETASAVVDAARSSASTLRHDTRDWLRAPDVAAIEADLAWLDGSPRNHIVTLHDANYPRLLREISDPPPVLFVHGELAALNAPQLAMVGSRNPTPQGEDTAKNFAAHLARSGLAITSGLALGIDAACHRGALDGEGVTIAVTGTGLDRVYPKRHHALAHEIAQRGALVSEFPPGTPPLKENFPRRNRIISGLSFGTLVVEASLNSGSLITAKCALEQGREVFAIPGSIHNPLARGCHALIRQGAKLVETGQDVFDELAAQLPLSFVSHDTAPRNAAPIQPDESEACVLDALGFEPAGVDALIERTGLTADRVSSILLTMEINGWIRTSGAQYYRVPVE